MITADIECSVSQVDSFAGEGSLTQKKIIHLLLQSKKLTINEIYEHLPTISEQNIAPLVTQLIKENKVWTAGRRKHAVKCGVSRSQLVYSALEEDRPADVSYQIDILNRFCGLSSPSRV